MDSDARRRCGAVAIEVAGDPEAAGYAATIPDFPFAPGLHVNYESTVLPMHDGLPKLKDFPEELGGSGEMIAE